MCLYGKKDDEFLGIRLDPRWRRETFTATKKLLSRLSKYGPFIQVEGDGTYYLATSGKRTLDELGIKDRPVIVVGLNAPPQRDPAGDESLTTVCNPTKSSKRSVGRGKTKRQQRPRSSSAAASAPTESELKEAHSKALNPVFEEMRPKLDEIRQHLISLSLHRTPPKKMTPSKAVADKENSHNSFALAKSTTTAKAGKTAYTVLVSGEVSNIFKTSKKRRKLCPQTDLVTLDLHGMSKQQALQLLDESLPGWVDLAMKGDHPFVLAVDIICGGGSQLLSEVVANWIGDNAQVANRPKGYLM